MGRDTLREDLIESGALVPVEVEGLRGKRFVLGEELALLQAPPEPVPSAAFIAPFDPLLWDATLVASLFGFDHVWEGFFKSEKRRWGYYVLPICFGDRFVGRIEPRIDRDRACVEVLNLWWGAASRRTTPTGSLTLCGTRSVRTCGSRARTAWSGQLTSQQRSGCSSPARDRHDSRTSGAKGSTTPSRTQFPPSVGPRWSSQTI